MSIETINGKAIRAARKRADLTQAELARKAKLAQPTLSLWETGRTTRTRRTKAIASLARVLKVEPATLTKPPAKAPAKRKPRVAKPTPEPTPEPEEAAA